jgi:hypothetical protein
MVSIINQKYFNIMAKSKATETEQIQDYSNNGKNDNSNS